MIFWHFFQVNNLFLVLFKKPTPSQFNLIKNAKNHFLLLKKFKNNESAQLCIFVHCKQCYPLSACQKILTLKIYV